VANLSTLFSSGVKAVYSGQATLSLGAGASSVTVPIPATTSKFMVIFTARYGTLAVPFSSPYTPPGISGLNSGTGGIVFSMTPSVSTLAAFQVVVDWQVVEFN
jgi:hypothetical protein